MEKLKVTKEINPHFHDFIFNWDYTTYFLVGGYGSSKSYHVGLKLIFKLLSEKRKALVVREVYDTMRDSVFSLLVEIIEDLSLSSVVKVKTSPLNIRFPNGSEIIFKGMDKPEKLKSINDISIIWLEEASEIKYSGYKELLGRARHPSLKIHFLLSTNPVSKRNWTYKHFFINRDEKVVRLDDYKLYKARKIVKDDVYYHHSTVDDNLFLPQSYIDTLDEIKEYDPDLYRIARKGQFGTNGTKVLPRFEVMDHEEVMAKVNRLKMHRAGMDFGFSESYNAAVRVAIDHDNKYLYIYWEYYNKGMTDDLTANHPKFLELKEENVYIKADSAEPKTIRFYRQEGYRMTATKKITNLEQIKKLRRFKKIYCSSKCINTISELQDLTFKEDKNGEIIEDKFSIDAHTFDAIKYSIDDYEVSSLKGNTIRSIPKSVLKL